METEKQVISRAIVGNEPEVLKRVTDARCAISVWQRNTDFLETELLKLGQEEFEIRTFGKKAEILKDLDALAQLQKKAPLLWEDIQLLLQVFEEITESTQFRLLFATINHNMCSKFHTDNNVLRLLCTYMGPGTLWLPSFKSGAVTNDEDLERLAERGNPGDVLLLKGAKYPGNGHKAILHRSPAVAETGRVRILLRIDMN